MDFKARMILPVTALTLTALLAACGGRGATPAPVPSPTSAPTAAPTATATPALYLSAVCKAPGSSSIVEFTFGQIGKGLPAPKSLTLDASSGIEQVWNYYANPATRSNFVCRSVFEAGGYIMVVANDGRQTNYPPGITHVFKVMTEEFAGAGLGYVGSWVSFGHQGSDAGRVQVVTGFEGLDLLITGSLANRGTELTDKMFSAFESERGSYNGNYIAQVTAHVLGQAGHFSPDSQGRFGLKPLQLKAIRPVFPLSAAGRDPQVEKIVVSGYEGKGFMVVTVSEDVNGDRNYTAAAAFVSLGGPDGFIAQGIKPAVPLMLTPQF